METKIFTNTEIDEAAACLRAGELVAFPTETVYGLGANALDASAVKKVFAVKGRPSDNPLIIHIENFAQVMPFIQEMHPLAEKIVTHFWPGPLTLIFTVKPDLLPDVATGGLPTAAFRMPNNAQTLRLIKAAGVPLVGPSANTSGKPSPTTQAHVYHDLQGKIAGILDDGAAAIGVESTVLDLSQPEQPPMILRPGAVTAEDLATVLGCEITFDRHLVSADEAPKSPGMKYKHYSPDTDVMMVQPKDWAQAVAWANDQQLRIGVLASPTVVATVREEVAASFMYQDDSIEAATKGLFAGLRALDEEKLALDVIFVETFSETGLGQAYMNRLKKAADQTYYC